MLPEQQQRILGYFLEEARDHLNTIEQGLLNLQSTLNDPEMINEVFRAAHSIKGGAAMLGLNSIQHTAHRLEDCFKVLKDNPVQVDEKLESLFLGVSDTLKVLLEHLSGPFGLSEEAANSLMSETEPVFRWLNEHLEELVEQGNSGVAITARATERQLASVNGGTTPTQMLPPQNIPNREVDTRRPSTETSLNQNWGEFQATVLQTLREMLQLFKQTTTPSTRQNLQQCCHQLSKLGAAHNLSHWSGLCQAAASAIANSGANANTDNSYLNLAKIVITEIKKAQELVLQGREVEIVISPQLNALLSFAEIELLEITPDFVVEQPQVVAEAASTLEPATADLQPQNSTNSLLDNLKENTGDSASDQLQGTPVTALTATPFAAVPLFDHEEETLLSESNIDTHGPVVGIAELNSLADLFEGDSPELDETWHQEEILDTIAANQLGMGDSDIKDDDKDLADFLSFDDDTSNDHRQTTTSSTEELNLLFGDESFLDRENLEPQNQPISPASVEVGDITGFNSDLGPSTVEILEEFTVSSSESPQSPVEENLLALTLDDNESLPTSEVTSLETENIASRELPSVSQSSFDDLESETTNAVPLEELPPPQPDSLSLDNLFAELEENTPQPTDESEIGDLFDSPKATAAEVSTSDDELSNFWNQTNEAQPNELDSTVEQDVARDLEESLFAAATSGEIFADSQQSSPSSTASFELEDFDITFLQPEQPQNLIFASDAGDNLFDDLAGSNSIISPAIGDDEVPLQEIRGFSQEPEALDFIPEFTNLAPETTAADSPKASADLEIDLFSTVEDDSAENLPLSFDSTYIQPELTDSEAGELFGNTLEDDSEENLPLSFDSTYIQPELTDSDAGELFGNTLEDDSEENLPLSFDSTYIQPELTDSEAGELFGNSLEDDSEENLPLSFDSTYIQPELTDSDAGELFGNSLEEDSEENLPLSFDSTYIQPELTDSEAGELFGNSLEDDSEENLPLSFDSTYIQPELTDSDAGELFGNKSGRRQRRKSAAVLWTQLIFNQN
ncbi:chemotaxis protein histidine kinase-like protein [Cylindrospermum stagnale PCC 7417]|uniref:Chemotaxis protein histidine kinase-like protein n=1 Tax=Cylindrospermum stagnale PCC 7417 TaxID=56107 RepID=K9X693_9NOST|nr:Hpt domain-containing protein [Cylindrospermum stagnale]AFZ27576.1 chemotaxis protein histidine kinase-like protein [Cylindrospermum stagnale PCC 7417]